MKTHRLIPIIVVLFIFGIATMTTIRNSPVALDSGTTQAEKVVEPQADQTGSDGFSSTAGADTKTEMDTDLYLDADEVEKRAAEEQSGTSDTTTSPSRVPVSFKNVAIPLPGGIDHAVAGVATRNSGQGVIRLRGIPPGSALINAFLVWGEIDQAAVAPYPVVFGPDCAQGATFFGQNFGNSPQPCWNGAGTFFPYITNVTPQILPGINGDYRVSRLHSALTDNRCPWGDGGCAGPGNKMPLSEGASLIVVYSNSCIPRGAQLYIHLGPGTFSGAHTATHFTLLNPIRPNFPNLKHSRIGADGQVGGFNCGLRSIPQISDERTWIENPATGGSIQIKGDVAGLNRDSDWNGYDGEPLNKLWDSHTDVFADSNFLAAGPPGNQGLSYRVRYLSQGDCISWVVHILGVR